MTTLAQLKSRIADDLARSDLTTQIADAITDAVEHYKTERFYFNDARTEFDTVADQSGYDVDDSASIPLLFDIDQVYVVDGSTTLECVYEDPIELEYLITSDPPTGRPSAWTRYAEGFRFYPVPDDAYTIRILSAIEIAAPADEDTTPSVWVTDAFELIRARAKKLIYEHVIKAYDKAAAMGQIEEGALFRLRRKTSRQKATGRIQPTTF